MVVPAGEGSEAFRVRQYSPLREEKCLFRILSETGAEPEGVLGFAGRFGLLGLGMEEAAGERAPIPGDAEPLTSWRAEIAAMRRSLRIWDMVQSEDTSGLKEYLSPLMAWLEADRADGRDPLTGDESADQWVAGAEPGEFRWFRTHGDECLDAYRAGDLVTPAMLGIQYIVNRHLRHRISPRILWDDSRKRGWSLYFVPVNLVGAIWLQLSQAMTQEKEYRRCRQCGSWFEIDHYTARTNRYFCSNACRSKAYRDRKAEARRLHREGMVLDQIAERLGSDAETVSGWVAGEKAGQAPR